MIDLSPALPPLIPAAPVLAASGDGVVVPGAKFSETLDNFLDAKTAVLEPQGATAAPPERQVPAEPGKDLPPAKDKDRDPADAAAQNPWLTALPLPVPIVAPSREPAEDTVAIGQSAASGIASRRSAPTLDPVSLSLTPEQTSAALPQTAAPEQVSVDGAARPSLPIGTPPAATQSLPLAPTPGAGTPQPPSPAQTPAAAAPTIQAQALALDPQPPALPSTTPILVAATIKLDSPRVPAIIVLPPAQPDAATAAIAVSALPQPASQVFAGARAIAGSWHDRAARRDASDLIELPMSFSAAAPLELRERAVHAAGQPASTALDLTRDSGLQQMVDRIETLRDAADAGDTRVRLIPDALGSIDVAVRQDGDRVHVRFTAEQDATRALIAEAQPRLTELAAARGVRIGETSVSTGGGGGNTTPQPRPAPPRARVAATAASVSSSTPDHRLA